MCRVILRTVQGLVTLYSAFVFIWFLANRLVQDSVWVFVVLDKFSEYFLLPAIIVLFASLLTKKALIVLLASIPVVISAYFYAPILYPATTPNLLEEDRRFRVATFNIWNHSSNIGKIADVIKTTQADVIALQEITEDQRFELKRGLQSDYPFHHISQEIFGGTTALFSKHPMGNIKEIDIQVDRPSIVADLTWQGIPITVVSAHLNPSFWAYWRQPWKKIPGNYLIYIQDQSAQVEAIFNEINQRKEAEAIFLACDCNSQEAASTNRRLRKRFKDAFRTVGLQIGGTGDRNTEFERDLTHIDYVWFSGRAKPNAVYRGTVPSESDHAPVIADFTFPQ